MLLSSDLRSPPSSSLSSGLVSLPDSEGADNVTSASSSSSLPPAATAAVAAAACGSSSASVNSDDQLAPGPINGAAGDADSGRIVSSEENLSRVASRSKNPRIKRRNWADEEGQDKEKDATSSHPAGDFREGFSKPLAFRPRASVKSASKDGRGGGEGGGGGGDGARESFASRRYESFRTAKDPTADLQPIRDPALLLKLQQSFTGVQLAQLQLSPKDQKMLALLLAKKEQEREAKHRRDSSYLSRCETNSRTSSSSAALRRQLSLNESRLKYQKQKHSEWQSPAANERRHGRGLRGGEFHNNSEHTANDDFDDCCSCRCSAHSDKDASECQQGNRNGYSSHENLCCSRYAASLAPSAYKNQHSKKQLQQAMERKKQVEQHLREQRQKTDKYLAQLKEKNEQEQQKATLTRQQRTNQLAEKSRLHNLHAHQKLLEAKETKNAEFKDILASHEEKKAHLTAAELKVKQLRENEKSRKESEIRRKLEKSQNRQRELEDELKRWQTELTEYRQMQENNAQTIAMARIEKKKEMITREREAKERQQKENLTRMLAKENEWRAELEAAIQSKDERSRLIQEEKMRMIQKSRDVALISRRIRDELGLNQSATDLDLLGRID